MGEKRPIGFTIEHYWCRDCAPEGIRDCHDPLREGDDAGIPWHCDDCGKELLPCDHDFSGSEWRLAYTPEGEPPQDIRFCSKCEEAEYRPTQPSGDGA